MMMRWMSGGWVKRVGGVLLLTVMMLPAVAADRIETASGVHEGIFGGYQNERFAFHSKTGGQMEFARRDVRKIVLEKPVKATLQRSNESSPGATVMLHGFEAGGFQIERSGRSERVPLTFVTRVALPQAAQPQTGLADGGGTQPGPRAAIDLSGLDESALSAPQRDAVSEYRNTRQAYDRFVAESSALVARMDAATGPARVQALNDLRARRVQEQALGNRLRQSEQAIQAALGDLLQRGGRAAPGAGAQAAGGADGKAQEWSVTLIDTATFKAFPDLNGGQRAAIERYDKAADATQSALDKGDNAAIQAAQRGLQAAERELLAAFPNVVFED